MKDGYATFKYYFLISIKNRLKGNIHSQTSKTLFYIIYLYMVSNKTTLRIILKNIFYYRNLFFYF